MAFYFFAVCFEWVEKSSHFPNDVLSEIIYAVSQGKA